MTISNTFQTEYDQSQTYKHFSMGFPINVIVQLGERVALFYVFALRLLYFSCEYKNGNQPQVKSPSGLVSRAYQKKIIVFLYCCVEFP
jgi:hypothetical protein